MELVLIILLILQLLATTMFGRFEAETPVIKRLLKWIIIDGITIGLFYSIGQWTIMLPITLVIIGTCFHLYICKKHGFDPIKATPRKKYYAYRKWNWPE